MDIALKLALVSSSVQKCEQIKAELWAILPRIAGLGNLINIKEIQHCSGPRVVFSSFSKQQVWELQISPTQVEKLKDGKEIERCKEGPHENGTCVVHFNCPETRDRLGWLHLFATEDLQKNADICWLSWLSELGRRCKLLTFLLRSQRWRCWPFDLGL